MANPTIQVLTSLLATSWSKETSSRPDEWSERNPARGQCVPSSLVTQDYLDGELGRYHVTGNKLDETHYFNILENGAVIDVAISQYGDRKEIIFQPLAVELVGYTTVRDKLLANPENKKRYELLKSMVSDCLAKQLN